MSDELVARTSEASTAQQLANELTPVQQAALRELGGGRNIAAAAEAAGVDRRTVSRWIHEDPKFAAAFNAWCGEVLDSGLARALAMSDAALTTIDAAIQKGHVTAALQLVKNLGIVRRPTPGSTDASELTRRGALSATRREARLRKAEVRHGLRLEEKLARDGISWTYDATLRLDNEERRMLEFLREKMSGRTGESYAGFAPRDGNRQLSRWEREVLFKKRAEYLSSGQFTLRNGEPFYLPRHGNGATIYRTRKQLQDILVEDGVDAAEAERLLAGYQE